MNRTQFSACVSADLSLVNYYSVIQKSYFILLIHVFRPVESDIHFRRPKPETLDNPKKNLDYRGFPDSADGYGHWISGFRFYRSNDHEKVYL